MRAVALCTTRWSRTWLLLAGVFVVLISGACLANGTGETLTQILKSRLTQRLTAGALPSSIRETAIKSGDVSSIVRDNLDGRLLTSVRSLAGTDFRFVPAGSPSDAQLAILILEYSNEATAARMAKRLSDRKGYFKNTKILTHFSYASRGDRLAIVFSENTGNEAVTKFIDECPEAFKDTGPH